MHTDDDPGKCLFKIARRFDTSSASAAIKQLYSSITYQVFEITELRRKMLACGNLESVNSTSQKNGVGVENRIDSSPLTILLLYDSSSNLLKLIFSFSILFLPLILPAAILNKYRRELSLSAIYDVFEFKKKNKPHLTLSFGKLPIFFKISLIDVR